MTKILSMFFTGLTLLSYGSFSYADCVEDLISAKKTNQAHRQTDFNEALATGTKQVTDPKVATSRIPRQFINQFCASDLQSRALELKDCLWDALEAQVGSEVQPKSQQACLTILAKYESYEIFEKCHDIAKSKFPDSEDAFYACM